MSREKRVHYGPRQAVWSAGTSFVGNRAGAHLAAASYFRRAVCRTELCPVPGCGQGTRAGMIARPRPGRQVSVIPCPSHRTEEVYEEVDLDIVRADLGPDGRVRALVYGYPFGTLWPLSPPTREEVEQAIASIEARPPGADDAAYRAHLDRFAGVVSQLRSLVDRGVSPAALSCDTLGPAMNPSSTP